MKHRKKIFVAIGLAITTSSAQAFETVIDFESQELIPLLSPIQTLTIDNVTFDASNTNGGEASFFIDDIGTDLDFSGNYLINGFRGFTALKMTFATSVTEFSFNLGNNQNDWELTGFDTSGNSISSLMIDSIPVKSSNNATFFGLSSSDAEFSYATLTNTGPAGMFGTVDEIELDNLQYSYANKVSPIPEPSTYLLMMGGLGMVGFMAYRRRKQVA